MNTLPFNQRLKIHKALCLLESGHSARLACRLSGLSRATLKKFSERLTAQASSRNP